MIREVKGPSFPDLLGFFRGGKIGKLGPAAEECLEGMQFVGSGKGALSLVLKYLRKTGTVENKLAEVMAPDWLGYWIYNQIQSVAFPAKILSSRTRAIYVYHQYGFPQDMDTIIDFAKEHRLVVIEDCAHSLGSCYKGRLTGSFGDFAIYSFSKWFFCFALGGVKSQSGDFRSYVRTALAGSPMGVSFIKDSVKLIYEFISFSNIALLKKYVLMMLNMSYALYGDALKPSKSAVSLALEKTDAEISKRVERYKYFRDKTDRLGVCHHLERERIVPYIIPVFCPGNKNDRLERALKTRGIDTGTYNFDVNRNLLSPKFLPCVWIPCHGGISDAVFQSVIDILLRELR